MGVGMHDKILLVNPPIYDFSAYDFWLKPYGLLRVAGFLRGQAPMRLFDYLDRYHPGAVQPVRSDPWGRGPFMAEVLPKPAPWRGCRVITDGTGSPGSTFVTCWSRTDHLP